MTDQKPSAASRNGRSTAKKRQPQAIDVLRNWITTKTPAAIMLDLWERDWLLCNRLDDGHESKPSQNFVTEVLNASVRRQKAILFDYRRAQMYLTRGWVEPGKKGAYADFVAESIRDVKNFGKSLSEQINLLDDDKHIRKVLDQVEKFPHSKLVRLSVSTRDVDTQFIAGTIVLMSTRVSHLTLKAMQALQALRGQDAKGDEELAVIVKKSTAVAQVRTYAFIAGFPR